MSLSVCLVTRNEEQNLPRVLRSVAGLADEVVVADTGSTDRTAAVATELGARVHEFAWDDDFAAARNFALDQATGDWVLWLNPDEELLPAGRDEIGPALTQEGVLGYAVRVQDQLRADRPEDFAETVQFRLFRRHPELRFVGRLHPRFVTPPEELAGRLGQRVLPCSATIRRHAYLSVPTPDKLRWALRLLERELQDRPGQLHYLVEHGRTLLRLQDPRGHEVLAEAAEQLRAPDHAPSPATQSLLEYLLIAPADQSRSRVSRQEARELALRWFPYSPPLVWRLAEQDFQAGNLRQAAVLLERLVWMGRTGSHDRSQGFDPSILGDPAVMNLGICYLRLGDLDHAEPLFRQLLHSPTHGAGAAQNLHVIDNLRPGKRS